VLVGIERVGEAGDGGRAIQENCAVVRRADGEERLEEPSLINVLVGRAAG